MSDQSHKPIFHGPVYGVVIGEGNTVIINLPDGTQRIIPADASFFTTTATRPEHFVGRQRELNDLEAKLLSADPQTVAITALYGMGGVGKTALAIEIVYDLAEHFPGGVLWADFASHQGDPLPILDSWAQLCGRPELVDLPSEEIRAQAVARAVTAHIERFGRMLAIFDDVRDTKSDAWLKGAHLLRKAMPDGTPLLITTRQTSVASSLRAHYTLSLDVLDLEDAVELVTRLIPDIEPALASELAKLTGSLPLAIEIAAALVKTEGLDWIIESLRDPETRVDALGLDSANRKEDSIRFSFSLSYQSLSAESAELFRCLGTFTQGYIASDWVAGLFKYYTAKRTFHDERIVARYLRDLANRSLLQRTEGGYRLHPLLRDYAFTLLAQSGEWAAAQVAHERYFLSVVTNESTPPQIIGAALENIMQAARHAYQERRWGDLSLFTQHLAVVGKHLHKRGLWKDALELLEYGLEVSLAENDMTMAASLLCETGIYQRESGEYANAEATLQRAIKLSKCIGNEYTLATALSSLGILLVYSRRGDEARLINEEAVQIAAASGNHTALGQALLSVGRMEIAAGRIGKAREYVERSVRILQDTDAKQLFVYGLRALGETFMIEGNYEVALDYFDQALLEARRIGDLQAQAYTLRGIGDTHKNAGQLQLALTSYIDSERLYRDVGDRAALAGALCSIGETYLLLNKPEASRSYFSESAVLASEGRWQARSKFGIAQLEHKLGNTQLALQLAKEALGQLQEIGHRDAHTIKNWLQRIEDAA